MSLERRSAFLTGPFRQAPDEPSSRGVGPSRLFGRTIKEWEEGLGSPRDGLELLSQATHIEGLFRDDVLRRGEKALFDLITNRLQRMEDFEALIGLANSKT